jgi:hypothetical protein
MLSVERANRPPQSERFPVSVGPFQEPSVVLASLPEESRATRSARWTADLIETRLAPPTEASIRPSGDVPDRVEAMS